MRRLTLLLALTAVLACPRPKPTPGPGDSTVVPPPDSIVDTATADTSAADTSHADTAVTSTGDTTGMEADDTTCESCGSEVTADDTLPQPRSSRKAGAGAAQGLPLGLNHFPMTSWCDGPFSATVETAEAKYVGGVLRRANDCGMQAIIAPLRRLMQVSDRDTHFNLANAKAQVDAIAKVAPPDTVQKYDVQWFALDEPQCADCWGGRAVSQSDVRDYLQYFRQKLGGTIFVRSTPQVLGVLYQQALQYIDAGVVAWNTRRGDEKKYFDKQAQFAQQFGLKVELTFNVEDCSGNKTNPCSASQVVQYGTVMASHPANCTSVSWQFNPDTWKKPGIPQAWAQVLSVARNRPATSCKRS